MKSAFKKFNIFIFTVCLLVLTILIYRTSDLFVSNSFNDYFKLNKKTSNYITFNYAGGDINTVYEIDTPKIFSDFKGRNFSQEYYDFEVNAVVDKSDLTRINYDIILKDMGNGIDGQYIKVYLTTQENKTLPGFDGVIPVYSVFSSGEDGKIIYSANSSSGDNGFRLRIWISDKYKKHYTGKLVFQIKVKRKTE